jgi:DNA gyrase inhibitor GyrI
MGVSHPTRVHCWELACRDQKGIRSTIPLEFRQLKQRREMRRLKAEAREVVGVSSPPKASCQQSFRLAVMAVVSICTQRFARWLSGSRHASGAR